MIDNSFVSSLDVSSESNSNCDAESTADEIEFLDTEVINSEVGDEPFVAPKARPAKRRRKQAEEDEVNSAFISSLNTICGKLDEPEANEDEDTYFAKSIGQQMKKMNEDEKVQFKIEVLQLAHRAIRNSK